MNPPSRPGEDANEGQLAAAAAAAAAAVVCIVGCDGDDTGVACGENVERGTINTPLSIDGVDDAMESRGRTLNPHVRPHDVTPYTVGSSS